MPLPQILNFGACLPHRIGYDSSFSGSAAGRTRTSASVISTFSSPL
jgi:hypothetical protein